MKILVNYATESFYRAQEFNKKTGLKVGGFDYVIENNPNSLELDFRSTYSNILSQPRGAGYWLWKPYCILHALEQSSEGDVIMYADSASHFVKPLTPLFNLIESGEQDVIPFSLELPEANWTKRDAFVLMGCDTQGFEKSSQRLASFILTRKSEKSLAFFKEYLDYCTDPQILTDSDNICGAPNYDGFREHRHDQSIFSLLTKKYALEVFRDPCQWGNSHVKKFSNSPYPQLIEHTRQKSPKQARLSYQIKRFLFPK